MVTKQIQARSWWSARSSLTHVLDDGIPPVALFVALEKRWASGVVEYETFAAEGSSRADFNLDVGALVYTSRAPFEIPRSLVGRRLEGLDCLALPTIHDDGVVAVLHSMFYVAASEYEDGTGFLWAMKGDLPQEGIPTLVKFSPLHFACNTAFWETIQEEFEVHVIELSSGHLLNLDTSAHKVTQEEDSG